MNEAELILGGWTRFALTYSTHCNLSAFQVIVNNVVKALRTRTRRFVLLFSIQWRKHWHQTYACHLDLCPESKHSDLIIRDKVNIVLLHLLRSGRNNSCGHPISLQKQHFTFTSNDIVQRSTSFFNLIFDFDADEILKSSISSSHQRKFEKQHFIFTSKEALKNSILFSSRVK